MKRLDSINNMVYTIMIMLFSILLDESNNIENIYFKDRKLKFNNKLFLDLTSKVNYLDKQLYFLDLDSKFVVDFKEELSSNINLTSSVVLKNRVILTQKGIVYYLN